MTIISTSDLIVGVEYITRDCLLTLRQDTGNREKLPTVQRSNYCQPGRNNDPWMPYDYNTVYCFCNDQNGCNVAVSITVPKFAMFFCILVAFMLHKLLLL